MNRTSHYLLLAASLLLVSPTPAGAPEPTRTVALWLFDEQPGIYPSCVLNDSSGSDYPLVLGPGGQIVPGKFGQALEPSPQPPIPYPATGSVLFGLSDPPSEEGRSTTPMTWKNANFCALMTSGENHLRKDVGFANATDTALNLGSFDWTVEFWFSPGISTNESGTVFELGRGPRGDDDQLTRLSLVDGGFLLENTPSGSSLSVSTNLESSRDGASWHHLAFVYSAAEEQLRHFVDGRLQALPEALKMAPVPRGDEAYFSIGRDGLWQKLLPGRLDELRFSTGQVYRGESFTPPGSFAPRKRAFRPPAPTLPLLWGRDSDPAEVVDLGGRKHLFIDDSFVESSENVTFVVNPPRLAERVIDQIQGPFRKHLSIVEDDEGLIRLYNGTYDDYLAVRVSRDGVRWEMPDLGREHRGMQNIVFAGPAGEGNVFLDPNAPPETRWKYVSGYHKRGVYLFESADGWSFSRVPTAVLPFRSGSQSNVFYDDQRGLYVGYHRSDYPATPAGKTQREFVMTETESVRDPWPFRRVSREEAVAISRHKRLHGLHPWYLDNGPLTPGGFGVEYPTAFAPDDSLDPIGSDIYVPKAIKYPWAPDTYLAFPVVYFHYEGDGPSTRHVLGSRERDRGSGPLETQLAVSRDGIEWKRYPRPAYVGIGRRAGRDIHQVYLAHGMVRRGEEIWQYTFDTVIYHSTWSGDDSESAVYRLVQRLDGFVSADTPYDRSGVLVTRPFRFTGNRLLLNIDTDAAGYAQVGFIDAGGAPFEGFSVDDCVYVNGDFTSTELEWMGQGSDVSSLAGREVRLVFRMRGSKLYSLQFVETGEPSVPSRSAGQE